MNKGTRLIHEKLALLGKSMGFITETEISNSLLSLNIQKAYSPRIDLMWSLTLDRKKREAIAEVTGRKVSDITHLPVVGIEVEGSDPSTKTMMSDIANIRVLGTPLGLLVISVDKGKDLYRRAARAIRTVRYNLGNLVTVPIEASWIDSFSRMKWDKTHCTIDQPKHTGARGGEKLNWISVERKRLTDLGRKAGFIVADPYQIPAPGFRFEVEQTRRLVTMREMWDPQNKEISNTLAK